MMHIETKIRIYAPSEKVWEILTDFESYPEWNPFIRVISGEIREGGRLEVKITPPDEKEMSFSPIVFRAIPGRELRWIGKFLIKGLFDGQHYFRLEEVDSNSTVLVHGEYFTGLLVGMMSSMLKQTKTGFEQMNQALKRRCEALVLESVRAF